MRPRAAGALALAVVAVGLLLAGCASGAGHAGNGGTTATTAPTTGPAASSTSATTAAPSPVVWLCRPGRSPDPCAVPFAPRAVSAENTRTNASTAGLPSPPAASQFACFYVYPTVSTQATANSDLIPSAEETGAAFAQASPFSRVCDVWAPMYRQETSATVTKGLAGDTALLHRTFDTAYASLLTGWSAFLAQSAGKPIVLIGDSQGAAILIRLVATTIQQQPALLHRLVMVIVAGGNLQVPTGGTVGATFTKVPLCTGVGQTGCAIAFSSYPSVPPADSLFGRPGQGVSIQSGQTTRAGQQVACVNPAALGGGTAGLESYFPAATQTTLTPKIGGLWVAYPGLYTASCHSGGGATWLQVDHTSTPGDTRPLVTEPLGPTWGYHLVDLDLTMGNLLADVAAAEATWTAKAG